MEVQKITLIILHGPSLGIETFLCNDDDGHTKNIVVWFQNVLWVYGMAWMRVRFPGLKFCPSPPLKESDTECHHKFNILSIK